MSTWATKKDSTPSLYTDYTDSVHRMFLSTLIPTTPASIAPCFIHRSTQTFLWARDLERGPCWKKNAIGSDSSQLIWNLGSGEKCWVKEKGERFYQFCSENLQKNYHSRLKNYLYTYRYWKCFILMLFWVVVIHFVFVLTLGVIPFKVTVAIRKNHCKFDPISWICQKKPSLECWDLWGRSYRSEKDGVSCWKSGVWVARTFVIFWGSGKKNGGIRAVVLDECPPNRKPTLRNFFLKMQGKPAGYCPQNSHGTFHVVWQRLSFVQGIPPGQPQNDTSIDPKQCK